MTEKKKIQWMMWDSVVDFIMAVQYRTVIFTEIPAIQREKAMAPHSSTVARKIPWMEELGGLQSMGSLRVRHD